MSIHHPIRNIWIDENKVTYLVVKRIDKKSFYVVYYLGIEEKSQRCADIYEAVNLMYRWTKDNPTFTSNVSYSMGQCEPLGAER